MLNFSDLNLSAPLLKALEDLEYIHPTPIQEEAFPVIMSGRDMTGIAQTGTGKTFAYLLPILRKHTFSKSRHPRALILVPTRELVVQVCGEIEKLTQHLTFRYTGIYGGSNINPQKLAVYNGIDLLVATPGRLIDLATVGALNIKSVQQVVIDEMDEMLDQGFRSQLNTIMELLPAKRQHILFSATTTPDIEKLTANFFINPQKIEVAAHGTPLEKIQQEAFHVPNYHTKITLLLHLLQQDKSMSKVMVFAGTKSLAERIFEQLQGKLKDDVALIHSGKTQSNRFATLAGFRENKQRVLVATDIVARGLDISDVTHVVSFDTPKVPGDYLHRIGRTGRAGKNGASIAFINDAEIPLMNEIEALMKKQVAVSPLPDEIAISLIFTEDELAPVQLKNHNRNQKIKTGGPAVHEKKAKNNKQHLGGPRRRNPNKTKPRNRAVERNRARKK